MNSTLAATVPAAALSLTIVASAGAGVTIDAGLANLAIFGPGFDPASPTFLRSEFFNTSLGAIGPATLTRPGVGVPFTQLSLSNFDAAGFSLVESGAGNLNWSAYVSFAFTPTEDMYLQASGRLFGDASTGLMMGFEITQMSSGNPESLFAKFDAGTFDTAKFTLLKDTQYTVSYQANYGLGGGGGNGALLDFSLTAVPAPGAFGLIAFAGIGTTRRRRN